MNHRIMELTECIKSMDQRIPSIPSLHSALGTIPALFFSLVGRDRRLGATERRLTLPAALSESRRVVSAAAFLALDPGLASSSRGPRARERDGEPHGACRGVSSAILLCIAVRPGHSEPPYSRSLGRQGDRHHAGARTQRHLSAGRKQ